MSILGYNLILDIAFWYGIIYILTSSPAKNLSFFEAYPRLAKIELTVKPHVTLVDSLKPPTTSGWSYQTEAIHRRSGRQAYKTTHNNLI